MDWDAELECPYVDVWPGKDGFDYAFQSDYLEAWKWLRDGLSACSEHTGKVRVLVEYKAKEPPSTVLSTPRRKLSCFSRD